MGAACSCCGDSGAGGAESYASMRTQPLSAPTTEADLEARRRAAQAAEEREQRFNQSATGRAARKAVDNVKKERDAEAAARQTTDTSKDWLS